MKTYNDIGIVSHDAGGANIILNFLIFEKINFNIFCKGPAKTIFKSYFKNFENMSLKDVVNKSSIIITGSSIKSNLELSAISMAKSKKKYCITFLESWGNFKKKFTRNNNLILPDEFWVSNKKEYELLRQEIPNIKCIIKPNYQLNILKKEIKLYIKNHIVKKNILYICDPFVDDSKDYFGVDDYWKINEKQLCEAFLKNVSFFEKKFDNIIIRPHPKENLSKYEYLKNKFNELPIIIRKHKNLSYEFANSNLIIGCASMAMVLAAQVGKKVISFLPENNNLEEIPYDGIKKVILKENNEIFYE